MGKTRLAVVLWLLLSLAPAWAASGAAAPKKPPRPAWEELTPAQQTVLSPIEKEWNQLDTMRRKKWVAIADRYPKMKPQEQTRLQQRMTDWAKLTPEERRVARERYQTLKKLPPAQRQQVREQWTDYQQSQAPSDAAPGGAVNDAPAATN